MEDFEESFRNELITNELERKYNNLLKDLTKESCFKHLRNISMQQILNVTSCGVSLEKESQKNRMHFAEIRTLSNSVDDAITKLVDESLNNKYRKELQPKITEAISNAISAEARRNHLNSLKPDYALENGETSKDIEELKYMSKLYVENLRDISKEMIEGPLQQIEKQLACSEGKEITPLVSDIKEEVFNDSDSEADNPPASPGSVSSVHTSDLSSFDDVISISSDEEIGRKRRRISMKEINKDIELIRQTRPSSSAISSKSITEKRTLKSLHSSPPKRQNIVYKNGSQEKVSQRNDATENKSVTRSKVLAEKERLPNDSFDTQHNKRTRRPNLKYASKEMISPFSLDDMHFEEIDVKESLVSDEQKSSRKRGRPRKDI